MKATFLYRAIEGIHRFAARSLGGAIAYVWRISGKVPIRLRMAVAFLALGAISASIGWFFSNGYLQWAQFSLENLRVLKEGGALAELGRFYLYAYAIALLSAIAALSAFFRHKVVYRIFEFAYAAWVFGLLMAMRLAFGLPASLYAADYKLFDKLSRNALWTASLGVLVPVVAVGLIVLFALALSSVRRAYSIGSSDTIGDRNHKGFKTGGSDPRYRTSWYWSIFFFVFVMVLPFLFQGGCEDPYGLVQGSGAPEVQVVKIKKIKKEKK
ncbi:MAG: hypothetical protein IKV56_04080, partial [Kiritimatiellae bacterium]|nr:hypothetical protein [Kiritimatiellia bacterium]